MGFPKWSLDHTFGVLWKQIPPLNQFHSQEAGCRCQVAWSFGDFVQDQRRSLSKACKFWRRGLLPSLFLLAWLLIGIAFLNKYLQDETVSTVFHSPFSESHQQGLAHPGWRRMLAWINPWSNSYSGNFETCGAQWVFGFFDFSMTFWFRGSLKVLQLLTWWKTTFFMLLALWTNTCKGHIPAHMITKVPIQWFVFSCL